MTSVTCVWLLKWNKLPFLAHQELRDYSQSPFPLPTKENKVIICATRGQNPQASNPLQLKFQHKQTFTFHVEHNASLGP